MTDRTRQPRTGVLPAGRFPTLFLLALFIVPFISTTAQPEPTSPPANAVVTLAILPFHIEGLADSLGRQAAEIVYDMAVSNGRFYMMHNGLVRTVVDDIKRGERERPNNEISLVAEVAKNLHISFAVSGTIRSQGNRFLLEIRAVDSSGRTHAVVNSEWEGKTKEILEAVRELANDLLIRLGNRDGVLIVTTEPPASRVEIDGEAVGIAPVRVSLPGGKEYAVSAARFGFKPVRKDVFLKEEEAREVQLLLRRVPKNPVNRPTARIWGTAGLALNQTSSSMDPLVALGKGGSFGMAVSFGETWRLRFGSMRYFGVIREMNEETLQIVGAVKDPETRSNAIYSSLIYTPSNKRLEPFIGLGLSTFSREIRVVNNTGERDTRNADYEIGWVFQAGLELAVTRGLLLQLELVHLQTLETNESWRKSGDDSLEFWSAAFRAFNSMTALRLAVGYRF